MITTCTDKANTLVVSLVVASLLAMAPGPSIAAAQSDDKPSEKPYKTPIKDKETPDPEKAQLMDLWKDMIQRQPDLQLVKEKYAVKNSEMIATGSIFSDALDYALVPRGIIICFTRPPEQRKTPAPKGLPETEQIVLRKIASDEAAKLIDSYKRYRNHFTQLDTAKDDLHDLQIMSKDLKESASEPVSSRQEMEMERTIKRQQRDIDGLRLALLGLRATLVDLAGENAVMRLDRALRQDHD